MKFDSYFSLTLLIIFQLSQRNVAYEFDYADRSVVVNPGPQPDVDPTEEDGGDIVADESDDQHPDISLMPGRKWRNSTIPYIMSNLLSSQARDAVIDAIADFHKFTCIRFVRRTTQQDYIEYTDRGGCWSRIGYKGGKQEISVGARCGWKGIAIHESMHALGFPHEQSRSDRDKFVTVLWENIMPGLENERHANILIEYLGQFEKERPLPDMDGDLKYDFESILHYGRKAFSANGLDTIRPKIQGATIGQRQGFSTMDIYKINKVYGCDEIPADNLNPPRRSTAITRTMATVTTTTVATTPIVAAATVSLLAVLNSIGTTTNPTTAPAPRRSDLSVSQSNVTLLIPTEPSNACEDIWTLNSCKFYLNYGACYYKLYQENCARTCGACGGNGSGSRNDNRTTVSTNNTLASLLENLSRTTIEMGNGTVSITGRTTTGTLFPETNAAPSRPTDAVQSTAVTTTTASTTTTSTTLETTTVTETTRISSTRRRRTTTTEDPLCVDHPACDWVVPIPTDQFCDTYWNMCMKKCNRC